MTVRPPRASDFSNEMHWKQDALSRPLQLQHSSSLFNHYSTPSHTSSQFLMEVWLGGVDVSKLDFIISGFGKRGVLSGFCVADNNDIQEMSTMSRRDFSLKNRTILVMFYNYFSLSAVLNLHTLCVHADITECYHNDLLNSVTIIISPNSLLKTRTSFSLTLLLYLCFYGLYSIVSLYCVRLSCLLNEYVMLCYVMLKNIYNTPAHK